MREVNGEVIVQCMSEREATGLYLANIEFGRECRIGHFKGDGKPFVAFRNSADYERYCWQAFRQTIRAGRAY